MDRRLQDFIDGMMQADASGRLGSALYHVSEELCLIEPNKPEQGLAGQVVVVIFGHLERDCPESDRARFVALKNAAVALAEHIDVANRKHRPAFHNRGHMLQVVLSGRAIDRANAEVQGMTGSLLPELSVADMACTAVADLLHDLDHDGGSNNVNGVYHPMKNEMTSLAHALPFLRCAGVGQGDIRRIIAMVQATDPGLPKDIMRAAYQWHFAGRQDSPQDWKSKVADFSGREQRQLQQLAQRLYGDRKTAFMAARLGDADLLASFGLGEQRSKEETQKLHREFLQNSAGMLCDDSGEPLPGPRLFALLKILGGHRQESGAYRVAFTTPGAQWLGGGTASRFQQNSEAMLGTEATAQIYKAAGVTPLALSA